MYDAVLLSLVTASMAFMVSETKFFQPARKRMEPIPFVGSLLACGFCLGHWVALVLVLLYRPSILHGWIILDVMATTLVVAWLAGFQWALMCWLFKLSGK